MAKILKIQGDTVQVGFDDGSLREFPLYLFGFPIYEGDLVEAYENEHEIVFSKISNTASAPPNETPNEYRAMAAWALALGVAAMTVPIPFIDIVAGVFGIILANKAAKNGVRGLATAALIFSIIGTIFSIIFTMNFI
ncbi:MAG: DUF4190 domain-containing protein [Turicibacter sp.]|nr:DUF4190 domain-containing protein [Turicibacter sp.]